MVQSLSRQMEEADTTRHRATPYDQYIGTRILMARTARKMSQIELGKALSVSFQQIQKYERGTNRVSAGRLFEIAQALNVEISYFFEGLAATNDEDCQAITDMTPADVEAARAFSRIENPGVRKRILALLSALGRFDDLNELDRSPATPAPDEAVS